MDPGNSSMRPIAKDRSEISSLELPELVESSFPLQRYKPLKAIGYGGAAYVYLCFDEHLKKDVAVKVLRGTTPDQFRGLQEEARVTARLNHPNVVSILDFGLTSGEAPYMVLEYVDGLALDRIIEQDGPLAQHIAADIFIQVAAGLEKGHDLKIFHRDIKSSNILISKGADGGLKANIIDFGIAFASSQNESQELQGRTIVGTPKYMSPDQLLGKTFDARSEIYSLGCVMYETLSGRLPFYAEDTMALLAKHASEPVPEFPSELGIHPGLEKVVMKCLEKAPERRYQSIKHLRADLVRLVVGDTSGKISPEVSNTLKTEAIESSKKLISSNNRDLLKTLVGVALIVFVGFSVIYFLGLLADRSTADDARSKSDTSDLKSGDHFKKKAKVISSGGNEKPIEERKSEPFEQIFDVEKLAELGKAREKSFQFENAEHAYTRAIEVCSKTRSSDTLRSSDFFRERGRMRVSQGRYKEAMSDFNGSIRLNPKSAENFRERAILHYSSGRSKLAREDISSALAINSKDYDTYLAVARFELSLKSTSADEALKKGLMLRPNSAECYAIRAFRNLLKKNMHDSERDQSLALASGSENALANHFTSLCYARKLDYKTALQYSLRASKLSPDLWEPYQLQVTIYSSHLIDEDKLFDCLNKSIAVNPTNPYMYHSRALILEREDRLDEAVDDYTKAIELSPTSSVYPMMRASIYRVQKKFDLAVKDCNRAIALGDKRGKVYLDLGSALTALGKLREAESTLAEGIRNDPVNAKLYSTHAQVLYKLGKYTDALVDFNKAQKLDPEDLRILTGRSMVYEKLGLVEQARKDRSSQPQEVVNTLGALQTLGEQTRKFGDVLEHSE